MINFLITLISLRNNIKLAELVVATINYFTMLLLDTLFIIYFTIFYLYLKLNQYAKSAYFSSYSRKSLKI